MTKNKHSLFSARAALPGGRTGARLRFYTLGSGADKQLLFSMHLWHAAAQRQERLARLTAWQPKTI
ncbi:MAG: hypothetical protein A2X35_09495 [Elusimicrobia bacterium GWA2_61_42]|nr:MAG: hypothetical protein A2X35_09495 [Elusimicrobia bacterium GWA2_61_42]OGR74923.1 MAG: hypothetical protein A2X38_05705 [Elusimicrobia bacterium GWC2_61_25]